MRLIKPQKMGYLQRSYGHGKDLYYVASPILFFDLISGQVQVENQQWGRISSALGNEALDHGLPKTCGEFLLAGQGYAPKPDCDQFNVSVQVAKQQKVLTVFGQRHWRNTLFRGTCPSFPANMDAPVPLTWENALGGGKSKVNPMGTGFSKDNPPPRVELDSKYIDSTGSKYLPASFLPMQITWPQRAKYQGKYKGDWFDKYFPAFSPSTDLKLFNAVGDDQHMPGFFIGDECFTLTNLHPEHAELNGQLPQISARAFVVAQGQFQELPLQLDTLWFLPDSNLGALIFRGQFPVASTDALEISDVLLGYENLADKPKSVSHYREVYALRTSSDTALANCMNDAQLSPELSAEQHTARQQKVAAQRQQKIDDIKAYQQKLIASTGGKLAVADSDLPEPELTPADDLLEEDLASGNIDLAPILAHAEKKTAEADAQGQQKLADLASRYPQAAAAAAQSNSKQLSAEQAQQNLAETHAPASQQQQALLSQQMSIQANQTLEVDAKAAGELRQHISDKVTSGESLACLNMTGADLQQMTFDGVNFNQAVLSFANLCHCIFKGCDLTDAALVNTNLNGCLFIDCKMDKAQLSGAQAEKLVIQGCQLDQVLWRGATLTTSQFIQCSFNGATMLNSDLRHSRFMDCQFNKSTLSQACLLDCDWQNCAFDSCVFSDSNLQCNRWLGCSATRTVMQLCQMQLNRFDNIQAEKWLFSTQVDLTCSTWVKCKCSQTNYRNITAKRIRLTGCEWRDCDLTEADFSQVNITQSQLIGCIAAQTNFTQAQFNQSNFYKSRFRGAQFAKANWRECNFLEADMMWAQLQNCQIKKCINFSKVATRDLKALAKNGGSQYAAS